MIDRAGRTANDILDQMTEITRMIDVGYEDLMAADRIVYGGNADRALCGIAQMLRAMADELSHIIRNRGGEVVRAGDAERRTCTIILQKLRARFGDCAVFGELEGFLRNLVQAMGAALATADDDEEVELRDVLIRYRDMVVGAAATLRAL
jgi:hypothetical protein